MTLRGGNFNRRPQRIGLLGAKYFYCKYNFQSFSALVFHFFFFWPLSWKYVNDEGISRIVLFIWKVRIITNIFSRGTFASSAPFSLSPAVLDPSAITRGVNDFLHFFQTVFFNDAFVCVLHKGSSTSQVLSDARSLAKGLGLLRSSGRSPPQHWEPGGVMSPCLRRRPWFGAWKKAFVIGRWSRVERDRNVWSLLISDNLAVSQICVHSMSVLVWRRGHYVI